ncbi:MAG: glycosyl hydrolase [Spirochaetia bacterium]|nr:glycosyl hydrolase [Spirochaetia bacterium]
MYTGKGFEASELGDVDVFPHNGVFHLFHLVLPNHDYIAHAVSKDGFLWRRVKNALFIGEPGEWDDDMVWTMHVSHDPIMPSQFRMFYTGLSRKEGGRVQRIGLARSIDLYRWEKVVSGDYPLSIEGPEYESTVDEGRHWVSCRDPFFFRENDRGFLLVNARVSDGPVVRRGCVGLAEEVSPDKFRWLKPLFYPRMYDDLEVPGLFKIHGSYYLFGNIKEDIKVHYWKSGELNGNYEAFASNVLLPKGNYAVRITKVKERYLVWNFYADRSTEYRSTILPPPTELKIDSEGKLYLTSYWKFCDKVKKRISGSDLLPLHRVLGNCSADANRKGDGVSLKTISGYEIFHFTKQATDFKLSFSLGMEGAGKTGLVFRSDDEANGHFMSLDVTHGLAQGRVWGQRDQGGIENSFIYKTIQSNRFPAIRNSFLKIELVLFGGYIELSINDQIILRYVETSYMDQTRFGLYVESAEVILKDMICEILDGPEEEDHQIM